QDQRVHRMEHANAPVVEAHRRENALHEREYGEQDPSAKQLARLRPREQRKDQQQNCAEVREDEAETTVCVEALRVVDCRAVLHCEQPVADEEELDDYSQEEKRGHVLQQHPSNTPHCRHRVTPLSSAAPIAREATTPASRNPYGAARTQT